MTVEWIGRYRKLVASLVRHGNIYGRAVYANRDMNEYEFSLPQWQVLEYLLEHPGSNDNMAFISDQLGLVASSFSKYVAGLVKAGFVDKYQITNNKKNVILRITEKGKEFYYQNVEDGVGPIFAPFFEALKDIPNEQLDSLAHALDILSDSLQAANQSEAYDFIKIE